MCLHSFFVLFQPSTYYIISEAFKSIESIFFTFLNLTQFYVRVKLSTNVFFYLYLFLFTTTDRLVTSFHPHNFSVFVSMFYPTFVNFLYVFLFLCFSVFVFLCFCVCMCQMNFDDDLTNASELAKQK